MKKENRGGVRAGAGRPALNVSEKKVNLTIRVNPELKERIKAKAEEEGVTVGRLLEDLFNTLF